MLHATKEASCFSSSTLVFFFAIAAGSKGSSGPQSYSLGFSISFIYTATLHCSITHSFLFSIKQKHISKFYHKPAALNVNPCTIESSRTVRVSATCTHFVTLAHRSASFVRDSTNQSAVFYDVNHHPPLFSFESSYDQTKVR